MIYIYGTMVSMLFAYIAQNAYRIGRASKLQRQCIAIIFKFLSFVPLTVISAIRYNVGTDFFSYYRIYISGRQASYMEIGFNFLIREMRKISANPQFFFFITSIWICACYYFAIYKESRNPAYSIALFVLTRDYFRSMNAIRQYMAETVVILAFSHIKKKEWKRALIFVALACTIHTSALIYIILLVLNSVHFKPKRDILIVAGAFVCGGMITRYLFPFIERYTTYARYFSDNSGYSKSKFEGVNFIVYISFFTLLNILYRDVKQNENLKVLYSAILLGMIVVAFSIFMPRNISRFTWSIDSFIIVYLPEATNKIPQKSLRWIINAGIIICYLVISVTLIQRGNQDVLPYCIYEK